MFETERYIFVKDSYNTYYIIPIDLEEVFNKMSVKPDRGEYDAWNQFDKHIVKDITNISFTSPLVRKWS